MSSLEEMVGHAEAVEEELIEIIQKLTTREQENLLALLKLPELVSTK